MSLEETAAAAQKGNTYELPASAGRWLAGVLTIARHEGRLLIYSPLTLIFQVWFLLALAILIFLVAEFYATDLAAFDLQWTFLPWVSLIMVPALAMRAFAEGPGDRGLELTFSLPLPISAIVVGKWLAGSAVLLVTLALTAPFAWTVAYLGEPDWGRAASGYVGAALLLFGFYAIALTAAAAMRDHVTAYIVGLGALTLVLLLGWDSVTRFATSEAFAPLITNLIMLSPKHWLDRMAEGRIEAAALAYFLILIVLPLGLATQLLEQRRSGQSYSRAFLGLALLWTGTGLILMLSAARLPFFLDLTEEREFTLHRETMAVAKNAPEGIRIDFFYSDDEAPIPARIRLHATRIRNLLGRIAGYSRGHITLVSHRTVEHGEAAETALTAGLKRVPMTSGESFLLGAVFRYGDRHGVIPYFDEARAELLEYDLALAIDTLSRPKTPKIGILSPLLQSSHAEAPRPGLAIIEDLKRHYDVAVIPHFSDTLPDGLDALIVIDAAVLKQQMLYAIDRHLMLGRGLIVMLDPYPRFNLANRVVNPEPGREINDISDLLQHYGARYVGDRVVGDSELAAPVTGTGGRQLSYPFWLRAGREVLSKAHPVTTSLNELLFSEAGRFEQSGYGANWRPLVKSTERAGSLPRSAFKDGGSEELAARFRPEENKKNPAVVAAALSGRFSSAFKGGPARAASGDAKRDHPTHTDRASVFVIADADWLFDPMALQSLDIGGRTLTRPLNDNAAFLLNMAEMATGNPSLIGIRSRSRVKRTFSLIEDILKEAQQRYQAEEAQYVARITRVEDSIKGILDLTGAKSVEELPDELAQSVSELTTKLLPFRRELNRVRSSMRERVETISTQLTAFNLIAGPMLAILLWACTRWRRRRATGAAEVT